MTRFEHELGFFITHQEELVKKYKCIDYVKEANRIMGAGLNRNDPCYCGSGKKYKHCHGML